MDNHAEFEVSCRYGGSFRICKRPIKQPGQLMSKAECGVVILHADSVLTYPTKILLSPFRYSAEESSDAQFFPIEHDSFAMYSLRLSFQVCKRHLRWPGCLGASVCQVMHARVCGLVVANAQEQ